MDDGVWYHTNKLRNCSQKRRTIKTTMEPMKIWLKGHNTINSQALPLVAMFLIHKTAWMKVLRTNYSHTCCEFPKVCFVFNNDAKLRMFQNAWFRFVAKKVYWMINFSNGHFMLGRRLLAHLSEVGCNELNFFREFSGFFFLVFSCCCSVWFLMVWYEEINDGDSIR